MEDLKKLMENYVDLAGDLKQIVQLQDAQLKMIRDIMPGSMAALSFNESYLKLQMEINQLIYKIENPWDDYFFYYSH